MPQLEQIALLSRLASGHGFLISVGDVATDEGGMQMPGQMIVEQIPQGTMGILAGSLVPGTHIDVQKQPDLADEIRVEAVRRTARLTGIVANFRSLLDSIQGFYCRIKIKNVSLGRQRFVAPEKLAVQPSPELIFINICKCPPERVMRDNFPYA